MSSRGLSSINSAAVTPAGDQTSHPGTASKHVLVIGRSVSLLAKAARAAGFDPLVVDAYGDRDTRAAASDYRRLHYLGETIDFRKLKADLAEFAQQYGDLPLCWGSGWEASGHLLSALATRYQIVGASPFALLALANPLYYARLSGARAVRAETGFPPPIAGCVIKDRMRAGGHSVVHDAGRLFLPAKQFRQRYLPGRSLSAVCLANSQGVQIIGWNEHFCLQLNERFPFRHNGAVSIDPLGVDKDLLESVRIAAGDLRLRGLFGVDFVQNEAGYLQMIEINPRPTATVTLHLPLSAVFKLHRAPERFAKASTPLASARRRASLLVYADDPIVVSKKLNWPTWVSDVPTDSRVYRDGEPLCSIRAEAATTDAVLKRINCRLDELLAMFRQI